MIYIYFNINMTSISNFDYRDQLERKNKWGRIINEIKDRYEYTWSKIPTFNSYISRRIDKYKKNETIMYYNKTPILGDYAILTITSKTSKIQEISLIGHYDRYHYYEDGDEFNNNNRFRRIL